MALIYLALACLVGWAGRRREIGSVGFFIVALLVTPPIAAIILWATSTPVPIDGSR